MPKNKKKRKSQVHAALQPIGVDIIDRNGDVLTGITEEDAMHLLASLAKLLPKLARRLTWADDIPF